jgi:poly(3-hydroxybutyrate) depolymerase
MAQTETVRRERADFDSDGTRCAAWLYRPSESASVGIEKPSVVVMGHGSD